MKISMRTIMIVDPDTSITSLMRSLAASTITTDPSTAFLSTLSGRLTMSIDAPSTERSSRMTTITTLRRSTEEDVPALSTLMTIPMSPTVSTDMTASTSESTTHT